MASIWRVGIAWLLLATPAASQERADKPFRWDALEAEQTVAEASMPSFPPDLVLTATNGEAAAATPPGVSSTELPVEGPLPESKTNPIGYASVADALQSLQSRKDVTFKVQNGWVIAVEGAARTIWSFAPAGHDAYPSVVKRQSVARDGKTFIDMRVLCEADKAACDALVREFNAMNQAIGASIRRRS